MKPTFILLKVWVRTVIPKRAGCNGVLGERARDGMAMERGVADIACLSRLDDSHDSGMRVRRHL